MIKIFFLLFVFIFALITQNYYFNNNKKFSKNFDSKVWSYSVENKESDLKNIQETILYMDGYLDAKKKTINLSILADHRSNIELRKIILFSEKENNQSLKRIIDINKKIVSSTSQKISIENVEINSSKTKHHITKIIPIFEQNGKPIPSSHVHSNIILTPRFLDIKKVKNLHIKKNETVSIAENLLIPSEGSFILEAGAKLSITEGSLLIKGDCFIKGNKDNPVRITFDNTSGGLFIHNRSSVNIKNLVITGGHGGLYQNEFYSGSLSIYNSRNVEVNGLTIKDSNAEDALSIKNSNVNLSYIDIQNSFSDGIDIDQGHGKLSHFSISNSSGDALDFYNSQLQVSQGEITKVQDKGISIGEKSQIEVDNVHISLSDIAIANKDGSSLLLKNSTIEKNKKNIETYNTKLIFQSLKSNQKIVQTTIDGEILNE